MTDQPIKYDAERWAKMPRWAQSEFYAALRRVEDLRRRLRTRLKEEKTNVLLGYGAREVEGDICQGFLRDSELIRFIVGPLGEHEDEITVQLRDGGIEVMGARGLACVPRSSNVMRVELSND